MNIFQQTLQLHFTICPKYTEDDMKKSEESFETMSNLSTSGMELQNQKQLTTVNLWNKMNLQCCSNEVSFPRQQREHFFRSVLCYGIGWCSIEHFFVQVGLGDTDLVLTISFYLKLESQAHSWVCTTVSAQGETHLIKRGHPLKEQGNCSALSVDGCFIAFLVHLCGLEEMS